MISIYGSPRRILLLYLKLHKFKKNCVMQDMLVFETYFYKALFSAIKSRF